MAVTPSRWAPGSPRRPSSGYCLPGPIARRRCGSSASRCSPACASWGRAAAPAPPPRADGSLAGQDRREVLGHAPLVLGHVLVDARREVALAPLRVVHVVLVRLLSGPLLLERELVSRARGELARGETREGLHERLPRSHLLLESLDDSGVAVGDDEGVGGGVGSAVDAGLGRRADHDGRTAAGGLFNGRGEGSGRDTT